MSILLRMLHSHGISVVRGVVERMDNSIQMNKKELSWFQKAIFKPFEFIPGIIFTVSLTYSITNVVVLSIDVSQIIIVSILLFALFAMASINRKASMA